jgi:hypothetical protein
MCAVLPTLDGSFRPRKNLATKEKIWPRGIFTLLKAFVLWKQKSLCQWEKNNIYCLELERKGGGYQTLQKIGPFSAFSVKKSAKVGRNNLPGRSNLCSALMSYVAEVSTIWQACTPPTPPPPRFSHSGFGSGSGKSKFLCDILQHCTVSVTSDLFGTNEQDTEFNLFRNSHYFLRCNNFCQAGLLS